MEAENKPIQPPPRTHIHPTTDQHHPPYPQPQNQFPLNGIKWDWGTPLY